MLREWLEEQRYQKYALQLLTRKIGMWDVPESLRRNPTHARGIYITGFRADRMVSRKRYEEDLLKLETEIALVDALGNYPVLLDRLQSVLRNMKRNLKLFELYDISDFH
ncbi:hypothetical protein [Oscillibacter sp.]|uniref:hypothetical protein n=1 Tax=Oscillibacter sp. TaxID=1945593 RepID=UPI0028AD0107|nr:hypothetical protein [Oscillibacter sp.]